MISFIQQCAAILWMVIAAIDSHNGDTLIAIYDLGWSIVMMLGAIVTKIKG